MPGTNINILGKRLIRRENTDVLVWFEKENRPVHRWCRRIESTKVESRPLFPAVAEQNYSLLNTIESGVALAMLREYMVQREGRRTEKKYLAPEIRAAAGLEPL